MSKKVGPDFGDTPGPALNSARWRFGEFELDEGIRELRLRGELILVEPKPLNLLMLMLRHPGELITKNDLIDALWTGRIVTDGVLASCVGKLRQVVESDPSITIKTIHGYGYRFDGPAALLEDQDSGVAAPKLNLSPGQSIAQRPNWQLVRRLGRSGDSWLAEHVKTRARRVFKFTTDPHGLSALKREVTIFRLLRESLGDRICYVDLLDWNFDEPPWFVETEYCSGGSLQEWFEVQGGVAKVPLATRLDLIAQIADALADVHIIGVLHKDLKPANVFVVPGADAAPRIRLADFGSGRLLDAGRLAALQITNMGFTQVIDTDTTSGTPLYLAPEVLAGHPATVKADIYALGVMLYQCVVGNLRRPLAAGWEQEVSDEMLREDIAIAAEGNPERRLANAAELARNLRSIESRRVEREAEREAQAKADRASRALERAKARRIGLIAAFAALTIGFVASALLYLDARKARTVAEAETRRAEAEAQRAQAVSDFLSKDMFASVNSGEKPVKDLTVKEVLDAAEAQVDKRFSDRVAADLYAALGRSYRALDFDAPALRNLDRALTFHERNDGPSEITLDLATEAMRLCYVLGLTATRIGHMDELLRAGEARLGDRNPAVVRLKIRLGRSYVELGQWLRGAEALRAILATESSAGAADAATYASVELGLGMVEDDLGEYASAERHLRRAEERFSTLNGADNPLAAAAHEKIGWNLAQTGRYAEAATELDTALQLTQKWSKDDSDSIFSVREYQAQLRTLQGAPAEAVRTFEEILQLVSDGEAGKIDQSFAEREPLALAYQRLGRLAEAEATMRLALDAATRSQAPNHPWTRRMRIELADIQRERGRLSAARQTLDAGTAVAFDDLPAVHPLRAELARVNGLLWLEGGDKARAKAALTEAQRINLKIFGEQHWRTQRSRAELGRTG